MILRRWKPTFIAFLAIFLSFSGFATLVAPNQAVAAVQTTLYASPTGSGTVCSQASPCSLEGARDQARTVNGNMTGDIIIRLLDGTYTLSSTFQLTESATVHDSGTNGYNIIYQADPGSHPVISGGQQITGWTQYDSVKNIYRANVGTSLNTRQLYVNGVRATRAKGALNPTGWSAVYNGFTAPDSTMASWGNISNIEVVGNAAWRNLRCDVSSISGTSVIMQNPCWANDQRLGNNKFANPLWIENAYELLDSEGEWYLDRTAGYLYYKPLANENISTATVVAPVLETLVNAAGTYATPLHNVQFYGITFAYATWLRTSTGEGYIAGQSGALYDGTVGGGGNGSIYNTPSNVIFSAVKNVRLERNTFTHLGAAALSFQYGSQNNTVIGNVFQDISASAIWMGSAVDEGHNVSAYYNNTDSAITYSGSFSRSYNYNSDDYQGDVHQTQNNNDYFQFTFTGSGVTYYGPSDSTTGTQDVYIDGTFQQTINGYYASSRYNKVLYTITGLSYGQHTIKVVKTGGTWMRLDAFGVYAEADPTVKTVKNNTIQDNYIAQTGVEYMDAPGINVIFTDGTNISHNEITNVPYDGISLGWGWGYSDAGTIRGWTTPTVAQNNTVQYNYIHDVMKVLQDGGGVYTLSAQANSSINNNYFREDTKVAGAIYLDEQTQFFNVNNNLVANIGPSTHWLYVQNYNPNSASRNNTFSSNYSSSTYRAGDWTKNTYNSNNQEGVTSNDVFPLQPYNIALNSGIEDSYRDIIPQSNFSLPDYLLLASVYVDTNAVTIPIRSAGDATKTVWLAPSGTTTFAEGNTMTKAGGTATSISVPKAAGDYKLYVVDALGNRSAESRFLVRQQWNYIDDKNASVTYSPAWSNYNSSSDYSGSESFIKSANSYAQYTFNGTGVRYLSMTQPNMGKVDVYIDGVLAQADIDAYAPSTTKQVVLYQNSNLLNGSHTIKVVCKGTKNASSSDTVCALDAFASISAPDQTAYYKLVNKNSGKVMDVNGGSYNSGATIIQWNDTSGLNQHWQFVKTASGDYKIINQKSGKVLDVSGGSTSTGANLIQSDDTNAASQHWQLIDVGTGNGYFKIKNTNSTYLADVTGSSTTAGAQLIQSSDTGVNSQQWQLVKVN
ncbi:RICIN domain-containing protein [Paenibacillus sp. Soil787]|uniref:RICIN domain-containing protein n=1 Tax=Paenibacillus sp. Soil787 TaxID=1736411 RepID=UPI0007025742|nr:RICIN domain-containing protein [Paenibacillus sp. Soil787]KRF18386.1 hypothetical protein ASG93_09990 [Paenibacillus sp. Soil787]